MKLHTYKTDNIHLFITGFLCFVLVSIGFWRDGASGPPYKIGNYYLGATPDEIGVVIEIDPESKEQYYEIEANQILLFFIKETDTDELKLYRIVKEEHFKPDRAESILSNLKSTYGTPNSQEIKSESFRPQKQYKYVTTVKNKAIWNISETQDFVAEIEKNRVTFELIDHDPEGIGSKVAPEMSEEGVTGTSDRRHPAY
jgi:hypothetical protein